MRIDVAFILFQTPAKFWFATGGAGFCISRGLALKMSPWARYVRSLISERTLIWNTQKSEFIAVILYDTSHSKT